jgi:hypothetical protein
MYNLITLFVHFHHTVLTTQQATYSDKQDIKTT